MRSSTGTDPVPAEPAGSESPPGALGAVLAGGSGSRLGGAKAAVELAGQPLISYPLAALAEAGLAAFVVTKPSTPPCGRPLVRYPDGRTTASRRPDERTTAPALADERTTAPGDAGAGGDEWAGGAGGDESLLGAELLLEPERPRHPLAGIVAALRHARRPLVVLACDFPFAPPALLRALAAAPEPLVVPAPGGEPQPLVARWSPALLPELEAALGRHEPLRRTVAALDPRRLDDAELAAFGDPARAFLNVNTPADLAAAAALLGP